MSTTDTEPLHGVFHHEDGLLCADTRQACADFTYALVRNFGEEYEIRELTPDEVREVKAWGPQ